MIDLKVSVWHLNWERDGVISIEQLAKFPCPPDGDAIEGNQLARIHAHQGKELESYSVLAKREVRENCVLLPLET